MPDNEIFSPAHDDTRNGSRFHIVGIKTLVANETAQGLVRIDVPSHRFQETDIGTCLLGTESDFCSWHISLVGGREDTISVYHNMFLTFRSG